MRDVLITGGIGKIGFDLVTQLLETNCNITILDLESKTSVKKIQNIQKRVRVVYGDIEDLNLVRDLVKRNDIVINYAGVMPPLANLNEKLANSTNFIGTKNIVDAINELNPQCVLIYMSFISVYGISDTSKRLLNVKSDSTHPDDYYSISLIRSEDYIKGNLNKYCILRMPVVLTRKNYFINHVMLNKRMDFITASDLNDIIINIMKLKSIYKKIYNISGFKVKSNDIIEKMYKATGELHLFGRKLYYGEYEDSEAVEKIYKPEYVKLDEVFYKNKSKNRMRVIFKKIINYPKFLVFKIQGKKK